MLPDLPDIGWPQIGALLVLLQRGLEDLYSSHNTRKLLAAGAVEKDRAYYRVIVAAHMSWLAAVFFLLPADAPVLALPLCVYLVLQPIRYWAIATLGRYWTHSIVTLDGAPLVRSGPYRYFSHPIYAIAITEIMLLPTIFGGWVLGLVIGALYAPILAYKIVLENRALGSRRSLR